MKKIILLLALVAIIAQAQVSPNDLYSFFTNKVQTFINQLFSSTSFKLKNIWENNINITKFDIQKLNLVTDQTDPTYLRAFINFTFAFEHTRLSTSAHIVANLTFKAAETLTIRQGTVVFQDHGNYLMITAVANMYIQRFLTKLYGQAIPIDIRIPQFLQLDMEGQKGVVTFDLNDYIAYQKVKQGWKEDKPPQKPEEQQQL